jgi:hypothetical protein
MIFHDTAFAKQVGGAVVAFGSVKTHGVIISEADPVGKRSGPCG